MISICIHPKRHAVLLICGDKTDPGNNILNNLIKKEDKRLRKIQAHC